MTGKTQDNRIHYLYRITNTINGKIYIGQTVQPQKRWNQHKRDSIRPNQVLHHAIKKYGDSAFEFEIIAGCRSWEDANETETLLIAQYNCLVPSGYNVALGGINAPKSEAWKRAMREWHASLSPEEKQRRSKIHSENMLKFLAENGHPCLGIKWTDEQRARLSASLKALDKDAIYTEEVRQHMSEAHLGIVDSEETKQKKSDSAKESWEKRIDYTDIKCSAPDCDVSGKAKYKIINGIRYCNKHGLRILRYGYLELPPRTSHNKGKTSHNRTVFTEEQIAIILADTRSLEKIAKDFGVSPKVIKRVKLEANQYV
jgi:group I intron endonuclease